MDEGESAEEAAVRELREETGYVGVVEGELGGGSGVMFNGTSSFNLMYYNHAVILEMAYI